MGHFLHFTRTDDGTLTDISATGGERFTIERIRSTNPTFQGNS
ncbi:hypothetical protein V2K55_26380 [Pseudomonas alliivorans]|nr:hypothetical protein [Pseudomonas alliivorans]MEE4576395.1 hypothetical protein [Pseudomonas alliivorans]MEE4688435.1 hypothetical protein [Pseudomonas alliivorans]MEE4709207.1 hypothetical protein [Pseudomonas alliivorans]MEE4755196.1 hypothetical protein [Pseudomonas alliivorans]MEE4780847.1 hypothetical protein [Pseudomonas alliivorans]